MKCVGTERYVCAVQIEYRIGFEEMDEISPAFSNCYCISIMQSTLLLCVSRRGRGQHHYCGEGGKEATSGTNAPLL